MKRRSFFRKVASWLTVLCAGSSIGRALGRENDAGSSPALRCTRIDHEAKTITYETVSDARLRCGMYTHEPSENPYQSIGGLYREIYCEKAKDA